jgi:hypothetical protein
MSLDVYLKIPDAQIPRSGSGIFVRENGETKEITVDEWNERFPDREPVRPIYNENVSGVVYSANITHNLGEMAREAGIYMHLWRPDEIGVTTAAQLIEPLRDGLAKLQSDPSTFTKFNPGNGWGNYDGLVRFVAAYLAACERFPNATVEVSR